MSPLRCVLGQGKYWRPSPDRHPSLPPPPTTTCLQYQGTGAERGRPAGVGSRAGRSGARQCWSREGHEAEAGKAAYLAVRAPCTLQYGRGETEAEGQRGE